MVNGSASVNVAQLVGEADGTSHVSVGDWHSYLNAAFRPLPGIKQHHHFRFYILVFCCSLTISFWATSPTCNVQMQAFATHVAHGVLCLSVCLSVSFGHTDDLCKNG